MSGETEPHRVKAPQPGVLGAEPRQHVLQRRRCSSPGTGLALLRGVGAQMQPPQVVHLGLAWCPDKRGETRGCQGPAHTHTHTHTLARVHLPDTKCT